MLLCGDDSGRVLNFDQLVQAAIYFENLSESMDESVTHT